MMASENQKALAKKIIGGGSAVSGTVALILAALAANEGGYVNHPSDPGGETNHGVTVGVARDYGYNGPMRYLPSELAKEIYVVNYIIKPGYLPLVEKEPVLALEIIDTGVNAGPGRAGCWIQQSLNYLNVRGRLYPDLKVDCTVGPATLAAFDKLRARYTPKGACRMVVALMDGLQAQHYMKLADRKQSFEDFMPGWTRTRLQNTPINNCGSGSL